jgi:antitoxin HicB
VRRNPIGSSFDDFLEVDGQLAEAEAVALKRGIAHQLKLAMETANVSKTGLAKRMRTSRAAVERLLAGDSPSVTLLTLTRAAVALGCRLSIDVEQRAGTTTRGARRLSRAAKAGPLGTATVRDHGRRTSARGR